MMRLLVQRSHLGYKEIDTSLRVTGPRNESKSLVIVFVISSLPTSSGVYSSQQSEPVYL
jgi:hypothetical protein